MVRIVVVAILAAVSTTFLPTAAGAEKLGIWATITEIDGKMGLGVDSMTAHGIARKLGVVEGSFIYRVEVKYGKNQVDNRKTVNLHELKKALSHTDISEVKVVWRKNKQWHENTYVVAKVAEPKKIDKPD